MREKLRDSRRSGRAFCEKETAKNLWSVQDIQLQARECLDTMSDDLNEILNEALPRWAKLTGTKLGTSSYTFHLGSSSAFQDRDLEKYLADLNRARTIDVSGTTAILLLRGLFEAYVRERTFGAHALLFEPEKIEPILSELREFHTLITRPPCEEVALEFKKTVRAAAVHYGYDLRGLQKHLPDERALGELRLAAARSCEELAVHQFVQGRPDLSPLQYNREIFEFTNINSFVHALHKQWISGITLALIRDMNDARGASKAFFVLGLRNGESLTILTDYQEGEHPEYHNMTRRPERQLDERARCHWFPYRLLNEDPVKRAKRKTALVSKDPRAIAIDKISELEPPEFIWLTLLFELVAAKYGGDFRTEEVSYTGEMVVEPHILHDPTHMLVVTRQYQPLVLPRLTPETATREAADTRIPIGHNAWMEERYGPRIPEILLNVVGERRALEVGREASKMLPGAFDNDKLPPMRRQRNVLISWGPDHRKPELYPHALDPTYFGTRWQIERNRVWSARMNMMQAVQKFAVDDFLRKHELMLRWYRARVARNMARIWEAVAHGTLLAPTLCWESDREGSFPLHDSQVWGESNILTQKVAKQRRDAFPGIFQGQGIEIGTWNADQRCVMCGKDPSQRASVFTLIQPDNPRALALLCGIPERKLPWPLQHWWTSEPYIGNSILDRVDPQDWKLDNPWRHLELQICIALSRRAFTRLRREYSLAKSQKDEE
jgi:hypothetical protein